MMKPNWLSNQQWHDLLSKYDGIPRCAKTGATEDLTVDHIVPRYEGGTDDVSNLQFLIARLNASKGARPDSYWSRNFYFDQMPDLASARGAQRDSFNVLVSRPDWFGQPISQISRLLYVLAWVVGAGKTLGMLTTTCAINALVRDRWGAARRADRTLVLTKDESIRDQIARDLTTDATKFGMFKLPPKIGVVKHGTQFADRLWLDSQDVIVACIQQLWGEERGHLEKLLHDFAVIHIDEPHYAPEQVLAIVDAATTSLCFGYTSTPIDGAGVLLPRMVRTHVYGYWQADETDRSMKYLDADVARTVRTLRITEAELMARGQAQTVDNTDDDSYGKNIEPAKSVVRAVVEELDHRDALRLDQEKPAPHRANLNAKMILQYPAHGMIACPNVAFARMLADDVNRMFGSNQAKWPRNRGWWAEVVHTDGDSPTGGKRGHRPLTPDHPWMRAKNHKGLLDGSCARLLFVVGMAREGVNNPYCGPIGIVHERTSVVEGVQRAIGRQIRAVVVWSDDKLVLCVPPASLDSVLIITHEVFAINKTIADAIDFVLDMESRLDEMPTIDDLMSLAPRPAEQTNVILSGKEKIDLVAIVNGGADDVDGWPTGAATDIDTILGVFAPDNPRKRERIIEWVDTVKNDPSGARRQLRIGQAIIPISIVLHENIDHEPTDADLLAFLRAYHPKLMGEDFSHSGVRNVTVELFKEHSRNFHLPPLISDKKIDDIRKAIAGEIIRRLGNHLKIADKNILWRLAGAAVKQVFGAPPHESVKNDSKYDTPQCHAILLRPDVQDAVRGWVIGKLIDQGCCPSLASLHKQVYRHAAE